MNVLHLTLIVLALVCFLLAMMKTPSKIELISAGLFCWLISSLV